MDDHFEAWREKCVWGSYDLPQRTLTEYDEMQVTGKAEVHGIEGVSITAIQYADEKREWNFVAQLTDTHSRFLAESHTESGVKKYHTFLDGDAFISNWGFGEDNCGNETDLTVKGDITRDGDMIITKDKEFLLDVVGRYTVEIGGKSYDTVCVIDIETYNGGTMSEQYIDEQGRTVLWRRFNRDDWAIVRYGKSWSEMLPDNEKRYVNGVLYVEWYDCITDYIL